MINIPIWVFVILVILSTCFIIFFSIFVYILVKTNSTKDKEFEEIFDEIYSKKIKEK